MPASALFSNGRFICPPLASAAAARPVVMRPAAARRA
jgi:hypothetical protein